MKKFLQASLLLVALISLALAAGCSKPHRAAAPLPELSMGVASFYQPTSTVELLAGYIPEPQGIIPPDALMRIDTQLRQALEQTGRRFTYLDPRLLTDGQLAGRSDNRYRSSTLQYWINAGKQAGVDLLIVPMVIDWQEREGSEAGVTTSAAIMTDFFLIDTRNNGTMLQRSAYSEKQTGLSNNLLEIGTFIKRKGRWVTAEDLTGEAIQKAIEEFGL